MSATNNVILYAEDDDNDAFLVRHAFEAAGVPNPVVIVPNGNSAIDYLAGAGPYADRVKYPMPSLVLLDLNMPGTTGLQVLQWIRTHRDVSTMVVIILTSSNQQSDIQHCYASGANGYLVKPVDIDAMVGMAQSIKGFWLTQNRSLATL